MRRVAITGATGFVGANLAKVLCDGDYEVVATRRATSRTAHLDELELAWAEADLSDVDGLARAFEGAEVVFHCAAAVSIKPQVTPTLQAANVEGTRNILEACRRARVERLVYCSSTVAVGLATGEPDADESTPWNFGEFGLADGYATTKRLGEELALGCEDLDVVAVNPGFMFGPYDQRPSSGAMLLEVVKRKVPGYSAGVNCFVDVRDVARGMVLAMEKGRRGERYILGDENLSYGAIFRRIAAVAGTKPPSMEVPRVVASVAGLLGDLAEAVTGKEPLLNSNSVRWGYSRGFRFSSDKARRELGYTTRPLDEGIAAALAWFRDEGMVGPLPNFP
ncbi:MAG TPA: SDR family oxidoreductase [Myxococcota bacterium]|nr:SDR family oxidoreductase [Myxococcota bacterium]